MLMLNASSLHFPIPEQVSGGTTASKAIEQECSKSYADAVAAFCKFDIGPCSAHDNCCKYSTIRLLFRLVVVGRG